MMITSNPSSSVNTESINSLIKNLCETLIMNEMELDSKESIDKCLINKLRQISYEILLKKSSSNGEREQSSAATNNFNSIVAVGGGAGDKNQQIDNELERELNILLFEFKIESQNNSLKREQYDELEQIIDSLMNTSIISDELKSNIVKFLLQLRKPISDENQNNTKQKFLLPKPFKLYSLNSKPEYLKKPFETNGLFTSQLKQLKHDKYSPNNPYLKHIMTNNNNNNDKNDKMKNNNYNAAMTIFIKFPRPCQTIKTIDETLSTPTWNLWKKNKIKDFGDGGGGILNSNLNCSYLPKCKFFEKKFPDFIQNGDDDIESSKQREITSLNISNSGSSTSKASSNESVCQSILNNDNYIFNRDWEHFGLNKIPKALPFATESDDCIFPLYCLVNNKKHSSSSKKKKFTAKIVPLDTFIADLKALIVGIQSDSFYCDDEQLTFHIVPDITVQDVLPGTMNKFISEFLECGTCYKRMQIMYDNTSIKNRHKNHNHQPSNNNGFMFKTLCSAINDYLIQFRHIILSYDVKSVLGLYSVTKKMMQQLCSLALVFSLHPNANQKLKPPIGSQLLSYLYKEINHSTQEDFVLILIYIFQRCTTVYFKYLQKWIYHGILDDSHNELFISFMDHYRPQTKYFYDKAYFIRKDFVPGFFQGIENKILQCGKYAQILKAYKPNHQLFEINYPQMSVCLSYDDIKILENECKLYDDKVKKLCGPFVTVKDIFNQKSQKRKEFYQMVSEKSQRNMDKWLEDRKKQLEQQTEDKKKLNDEIQAQLEENKKRKIQEKKKNLELELKLLREAQELEDKQLVKENLELQKRVEYYKELQTIIDKNIKKVEFNRPETIVMDDKESPGTSSEGKITEHNDTTPSGDTDFESCLGDDDDNNSGAKGSDSSPNKVSVTEEISSLPELVDKFKETEKQLSQMKAKNETDDENETNNENNNVNELNQLKKSTSDILNSNEISELTRNRNKVLGSNLNFNENVNDTTSKLRVELNDENLTEAQKIKLKHLSKEFNICTNEISSSADVNSNIVTLPETELTDLQKNRIKMMQSENTFGNFDKEPNRKNLCLDLNTERARNRQKILSSEFDLPPILFTPKGTTSIDVTPMSTTSDPSSSHDIDHPIRKEEMNANDDAANQNADNKNKNLCLDIEKAKMTEITVKINDDITSTEIITETAEVYETPESALNTAGLSLRKGFNFTIINQEQQQQQEKNAQDMKDISIINDELTPADNNYDNNMDPYRRCEELINSNFKCNPKNSIFTFKKYGKMKSNKNDYDYDDDDDDDDDQLDKTNLDVTNIITLTEFIKKSIMIPLNTHMEIMNNEIMRIFLQELDILGHFKSLRNYFFLMDGEFGSIICDGLISKLENGSKPFELFNYQVLHTILENAFGSSIIGNDKNSNNLSFIVCDMPEKFDLSSPSVLNSLSLSYRVLWPINLILNPETLQQYCNIFKYLIKVRRISWLLEDIYTILKELLKKYNNNILMSSQYRHVQQIRHKFYNFVSMLQNHITSNALQASWKQFKDDLLTVNTIEDIYRKHTIYIKRILFLCLLNKRSIEFNNAIENIFKVTIRFVKNLKSREWKRKPNDEFYTHPRYERLVKDELEFEKLIKYVIYLGNKIVKHGYQEEIGEFISLINFNNYYSIEN